MKTTPSLRDRLRAQLADLKMPGALEALDDILGRIDGGHLKAPEALEALLGAQIGLRNNRRLVAAMRSYDADLVEIATLDPSFRLDIRYATANNFVGRPIYPEARIFLQRPTAEALVRVQRTLKDKGYGLLVFDGYRPWTVTKLFWDITPADKRNFVADPREGSKHNRGCAVDLSMIDFRTGREVEMPSLFDEMSERASASFAGGTPEQRERRDTLRRAMEKEGFEVYPDEWWHFDYKDWKRYPILNRSFEDLAKPADRE